MPIAEPPADFNLWPDVRAIAGWPTSDEDGARALAQAWRTGGEGFTQAGAHDVGGLAEGWPDGAGQAFHARVGENLRRASTAGADMTEMARRVEMFAAEVTGVKQGINNLMAANIGIYRSRANIMTEAARAGFVQELAGLVTEMMTASAARIGAAAGPIRGVAQPAASAGPPAGATPAQVRDWFQALPLPERYAIANDQPDLIRNLDGVPSGFRDIANQAVLDRELASLREYEQQLATASIPPAPGQDITQVRRTIEGLEEIRDRLAGDPDLFLIGLDTSGDGQAIIASGNPDDATNVVTHLPGVGHDLGGVTDAEALDRAIALRTPPGGAGPDPATSAIYYLGYDAPDDVAQANTDSYAAAGAAPLRQFQEGLRALNSDAHLTVEGHSYGSTVIGHAARGLLAADDVVLVASTDPGVQHVSEYRLDRVDPAQIGEHVHVTTAGNDPLAQAGTARHGNDPTDPAFGANVFYTRPNYLDLVELGPDVGLVSPHSNSYTEGNPALDRIREILRGG